MPQIKSFLLQGRETHQSVDILISFTDMTSKKMHEALHHHLVDGCAVDVSCSLSSVTKSNFSRDLKILNEVARKIDVYFEINYKRNK